MGIHYDALHSGHYMFLVCANSIATVVLRNNDASSIWIEEQFGGVKTQPVLWVPWSVHAIAINLAGAQARYENVPVIVGTVRRGIKRNHASRVCIVFPVKKQQIHCGCPMGEYAEIDAVRKDRCSQ